jgi:hypothetical protein
LITPHSTCRRTDGTQQSLSGILNDGSCGSAVGMLAAGISKPLAKYLMHPRCNSQIDETGRIVI